MAKLNRKKVLLLKKETSYGSSPSLSGSSVGGMQHSLAVIISPSTTSEFTVKLQGYSNQDGGSNRFRINWYETQSTLTVFEIGA